jgi:hypothetical protein
VAAVAVESLTLAQGDADENIAATKTNNRLPNDDAGMKAPPFTSH